MSELVRVPFDIEMAKKITNKEIDGRIVTRGNYNARIICWDKQSDCHYNIIALIDCIGTEKISTYDANGCVVTGEKEANDLFLEIPQYLTLKDGDVIADDNGVIAIEEKPKYEFKPFDKVLVRFGNKTWIADLFSHMNSDGRFICVGNIWEHCIPYEGNEHLLGTTDKP